MGYQFTIMTQEQAEDIAFNWHYDGEYSFYDMEADKDDLAEFINPETRGESMFAVTVEDELVAFLGMTRGAATTFDIGIGMKPALTGGGKGTEFLKAVMDFIESEFKAEKITLSVAAFNERAIKVYRKIGFEDAGMMTQETNGGLFEFLTMEYTYKKEISKLT